MTATTHPSFPNATHGPDKAITLALSLAQAEKAIHEFTSGQVDAIVDSDGRAYLLRAAQEHLRQDENRLRTIQDSVGDGITVVNRDGLVVSQNRAASRMLGYRSDEMVGLSVFDLVESGELHQFHSAFFNVLEEFRADAFVEFHLRSHDGSYRRIEAIVSKLREVSANCVVLTCRDTTLRRPTPEPTTLREAALTAALLDRDRFLAVLAHELRAPLSPILLGIAELQEDEHSPEIKATLEMISRNVDVQSRLIGELGDFTAVGQHKVRLRPEPLDTHEVIAFVVEICRNEIDAAQIGLSLDLSATDSVVVADSVRLQQPGITCELRQFSGNVEILVQRHDFLAGSW
jgi:PAS domain S-box-containing protein